VPPIVDPSFVAGNSRDGQNPVRLDGDLICSSAIRAGDAALALPNEREATVTREALAHSAAQ